MAATWQKISGTEAEVGLGQSTMVAVDGVGLVTNMPHLQCAAFMHPFAAVQHRCT